jgi:gluconate 2-dehydrogenase gamma chain
MARSAANSDLNRRDFLRLSSLAAGAIVPPLAAASPLATAPVPPAPATEAPAAYLSLGPDEAALVERLVDVMCPADELSPAGTELGLAQFIDRQLAGAFGQGQGLYLRGPFRPGIPEDGYQRPLNPLDFFRHGLHGLDQACRRRRGGGFADLDAGAADAVLTEVAAGGWDAEQTGLSEWFNDLLYPLFVQACFADPVYGGNRGKTFWRLVGYPGLPAVYSRDMITYRGRPHPAAMDPKSIEDFS